MSTSYAKYNPLYLFLDGPFFGNPSNGQTNLSEAFLERESRDTLQNLSREEAVDVLPSICEETSKTFDASNILSDICYKNEEHLSELEDDDIYGMYRKVFFAYVRTCTNFINSIVISSKSFTKIR